MATKTKTGKTLSEDTEGKVQITKEKQTKVDANKMTLEERILRIEIELGIVEPVNEEI